MRGGSSQAFDHVSSTCARRAIARLRSCCASSRSTSRSISRATRRIRGPAFLRIVPAPIQVELSRLSRHDGRRLHRLHHRRRDRAAVRARSRSTPRRSSSCRTAIRSTTPSATIAERDADARRTSGLPEEGFVFCCFNNNYKITPAVFDVWMRLLRAGRRQRAVAAARQRRRRANLRSEAQARGIDPARLVFAPRARSRIIWRAIGWPTCSSTRCRTTPTRRRATRCGWALPVVTCLGNASRAGWRRACCSAVGLPELVTHSLADYEALALRLARDPALLRRISRRRLAATG